MAVRKERIWSVSVEMSLGNEKTEFHRTVNLDEDVRTVLSEMLEVKTQAQDTICAAYDSILATSAQDMSKRMATERRGGKRAKA